MARVPVRTPVSAATWRTYWTGDGGRERGCHAELKGMYVYVGVWVCVLGCVGVGVCVYVFVYVGLRACWDAACLTWRGS